MPPSLKKKAVTKRSRQRNLVGAMILKLRNAHQLTRDELAAKLQVAGWEVSAEVVRQIELGLREVNDIELRIIAKRLKVPPAVLLE